MYLWSLVCLCMCCLSTLVSKLCDPMARDKCHQKDQETRELCNRSKSDFLGFAEHSIWNMKLNAFRRGAFEPQIPPLSIALHWLLHIYIICLVLQSWVCDHLKGRRYATIGPWIVSWIISLLQRQRLESNHHQISWKWGLLGTTLFFFFFSESGTPLLREGNKSHLPTRERFKIIQVGLEPRLHQWDSLNTASSLYQVSSELKKSWDMREVEGEKTQRPWGTHFKLVCPGHGPLPEDGGGMGWHPDGQTDCSNSPFYGLIGR